MTAKKAFEKIRCLFYILTLFLWSICSGASSVSEITETVCGAPDCYVNSSAAITSAGRHLPAQEYLSARDFGAPETLSAARNRSVRPLSRSVRQIVSHLFSDNPLTNLHTPSGLLMVREIPAHNLCGIKITNYIHLKDGQKSWSFFTRFTKDIAHETGNIHSGTIYPKSRCFCCAFFPVSHLPDSVKLWKRRWYRYEYRSFIIDNSRWRRGQSFHSLLIDFSLRHAWL